MIATDFSVTIRQETDRAVLLMEGDINAQASEQLTQAYVEATRGHTHPVELNFTHVEYINSTGIAVIVSLLAKARVERRLLSAVGLNEHYREIFKITRLSDFIQIN